MDRKWWSILGLCGLVALLCSGEDKKASSMSGLRKRRSRRLYYIYDGKTITREQVNEAKRLAKAGYGTLYATWAYTANEAKGLIREGRAERVSGVVLHGLDLPQVSDSLPPILGWVGGKTRLADKIISMMPPHKTYVEPFLGGGSVFFKKPLAEVNVINDLDKDLMNFYKGVRDGSCEKIRECKLPKNRKEFDRAVENKSRDICSYLGVNKKSYGSVMYDSHQHYTDRKGSKVRFDNCCEKYKDKLSKSKLINKSYRDVIRENDSKDTLFYLDPPYAEVGERLYEHGYVNPNEVGKLVKSMKGKAIVSYNNHPDVRKAFAGLTVRKLSHSYTFNKPDGKKDISELIITNF